jgi:hypothetical protein
MKPNTKVICHVELAKFELLFMLPNRMIKKRTTEFSRLGAYRALSLATTRRSIRNKNKHEKSTQETLAEANPQHTSQATHQPHDTTNKRYAVPVQSLTAIGRAILICTATVTLVRCIVDAGVTSNSRHSFICQVRTQA